MKIFSLLLWGWLVVFKQGERQQYWSAKNYKAGRRQRLAGKRMIPLRSFPVNHGGLMNRVAMTLHDKGSQKADNFKFTKDVDPLDLERTCRIKLPFHSPKILSLQSNKD